MAKSPLRFLVSFLTLMLVAPAWAGYVVTGPVRGQVCAGFIIEKCRMVSVDAVRGKDGRLYSLAEEFPDVSDFRDDENGFGLGRCWIRLKSSGAGLWSRLANLIGESFYTRTAPGKYEEIDVEYLVFDCVRTR